MLLGLFCMIHREQHTAMAFCVHSIWSLTCCRYLLLLMPMPIVSDCVANMKRNGSGQQNCRLRSTLSDNTNNIKRMALRVTWQGVNIVIILPIVSVKPTALEVIHISGIRPSATLGIWRVWPRNIEPTITRTLKHAKSWSIVISGGKSQPPPPQLHILFLLLAIQLVTAQSDGRRQRL